ncbi:hypothetical protein LCGC14_1800820, partial [marine sediment metagenome]
MSTVDKIDEAILELKTEVTQRGDSIAKLGEVQAGSPEAKAAWHLNQAKELLAPEEVSNDETPVIPPTREEPHNDQAERQDPAVPSEAGQEGEVPKEATEGEETEESGVAVDTSGACNLHPDGCPEGS